MPFHYRWALVPAACGSALCVFLFLLARNREWWTSWNRWAHFGVWPVFSDLSLTLQHLRDADQGLDPLADSSADFAYPRAVLALHHLGLQHIPSEWLGLLQGVLFTLAVIAVLRPFSPARAFGAVLMLAMPAMLLGFERGNVDFTVFVLCAAAGIAWSRTRGPRHLLIVLPVLMIGAILKLYPVFAVFAGAIGDTARRRIWWLVASFGVVLYWFLGRAEFPVLASKIPVMTDGSWGALVSFAAWENYIRTAQPGSWLTNIDWNHVALCVYAAAAAGAVLLGRRLAVHFITFARTNDEWCHYWLGAGICCGCFVAANFVYRWAFALLTVPLLLRALQSSDRIVIAWARMTLCALLVSLGAKFSLQSAAFIFVQLANWSFALGLLGGCAALQASMCAPTAAAHSSRRARELAISRLPANNTGH